jgi:hypothetical protein
MSCGVYEYNIGDFVVVYPQSKYNMRIGFIYDEVIPEERYLLYIEGNIEEHSKYSFVIYDELIEMYDRRILKREMLNEV